MYSYNDQRGMMYEYVHYALFTTFKIIFQEFYK